MSELTDCTAEESNAWIGPYTETILTAGALAGWLGISWMVSPIAFCGIGITLIAYPILFSPHGSSQFSQETKHQFEWTGSKEGSAPGRNDAPTAFDGKDRRGVLTLLFHRYLAHFRDFRSEGWTRYEQYLEGQGRSSQTYTDPEKPLEPFQEESSGLYLFVHGLKGHASAWNGYKKAIEQKDAQADVRLIKVLNGGDCPVREAADKIDSIIHQYIQEHPNKPIALVGTSRGGPIVAELECRLRETAPKTKVFVATIAGAHEGTLMMNLLKTIPFLGSFLYGEEVIEELSYNSDKAKELENKQSALTTAPRRYINYCTTEEFQIQPCTGSLQSHAENYYIHGSGHISIVDRVKAHLLQKLEAWKQENYDTSSSSQDR